MSSMYIKFFYQLHDREWMLLILCHEILLDINTLHKSNEKFDFFVLVTNCWTFEFVLLVFLFTDLECLSEFKCCVTIYRLLTHICTSHILQKIILLSEVKLVSPISHIIFFKRWFTRFDFRHFNSRIDVLT